MPRFYVAQTLAEGQQLDLPPDVAHHLHVLRLAPGDSLTLFNGEGGEYTAVLNDVQKKRAGCVVLEKAVELGAGGLQPLAARRSVVRLSAERAEKKLEHWQGVVVAASEQSGRNRLLQVAAPAAFSDWIRQQDLHKRIILTPRASESLAAWARHQPPQALTIMVGPEGGFSDEEEAEALRHGALPLAMGPRILRTETAGLAALAILGAAWGAGG
jgi:16S rRNA (uracil1498-N3)-methyltransferase